MDAQKRKHHRQLRRRQHVRSHIQGTAARPRLSVFRSSKHISAQLIDDINGVTLAAASSAGKAFKDAHKYGGNIKAAEIVGQKLADAAKAKGITAASFDRGHYRFHGRIRALAVAATKAGLVCCVPENIKVKSKDAAPAPVKPEKEKKPKGERPSKPKAEATA
ncbi:MAG: 50S ribosomal protein L18 [Planctomycetes bacterium]|nr:50S ribosomal protein L18 [Planctomycetota bacterium]